MARATRSARLAQNCLSVRSCVCVCVSPMASCFSYTQQFIHSYPLALCFTHINLFARALWPRSRCAPLATHDTHSNNFHPCPMAACFTHNNLFARDLWPRDLHTTICSLVPCGLVLGTQQFIHSCPVACLTHNNYLLARALWPRSRCARTSSDT